MDRGCKRQRVQHITTTDELHQNLPSSLRNIVDDCVYSLYRYEHGQKMQETLRDLRCFYNDDESVLELLFHIHASKVEKNIKNGQLQDGVEDWELQEYIKLTLPLTSLTKYFENGDALLLMRKYTNEYFTYCERCNKYYVRGNSVTWYTESLTDPLTGRDLYCMSACKDCVDQLANDGCVFPTVNYIA
jgi:hypothetical protein